MSKKFVIVSDGDYWEGLYVDGKLVAERHHHPLKYHGHVNLRWSDND